MNIQHKFSKNQMNMSDIDNWKDYRGKREKECRMSTSFTLNILKIKRLRKALCPYVIRGANEVSV